ncbi:MAG: stage 0 sporulation protein [Armatimonadetes bacterium]|nr:stage 0 sporulation protein [Armatimonadota bacterium]MDW8121599.1 regulatory iron-sulfur-containing complex subunit RicT [Armatimonadota bacterium]
MDYQTLADQDSDHKTWDNSAQADAVAVLIKPTNQVLLYDARAFRDLRRGDVVIVETRFGPQVGWVKQKPASPEDGKKGKRLIRKATADDVRAFFHLLEEARRDMQLVKKKVDAHNLPMHLLDAEYPLDKNQLVVYFTAEGRVDFRALVADLKASFPRRVMLFQVGVRDAIRMVGALGPCGRPTCCQLLLRSFESISLKMARDQFLELNPARLLGACGRLKCCLRHEYDFYVEMSRSYPHIGDRVQCPKGWGQVTALNFLMDRITVTLETGGCTYFSRSQVQWTAGSGCPYCPVPATASATDSDLPEEG